ncbi:caspase family protein, partial [bacterium]|nr:caspase family protein [bacterium]
METKLRIKLIIGLLVFFISLSHARLLMAASTNLELVIQTDKASKGVVFSPSEDIFATASENEIVLWTKQGLLLRTLEGHTDKINSLAFTPDGTNIISCSVNESIQWNLNGEQVKVFQHKKRNRSSAFRTDGRILLENVFGGFLQGEAFIEIWNMDGISQGIIKPGLLLVNSLTVSPDGTKILTGVSDAGFKNSVLKLWKIDGTFIKDLKLNQPAGQISPICFLPDGKKIAGISLHSLMIWDTERGELEVQFREESEYFRALTGMKDGGVITVSNGSRITDPDLIRIWYPSKTKRSAFSKIALKEGEESEESWSEAESEEESREVVAPETDDKKLEKKARISSMGNGVAISPDNSTIVATSDRIDIFNANLEPISSKRVQTNRIKWIDVNPSGKTFAMSTMDDEIKIWSLEDLSIKRSISRNNIVFADVYFGNFPAEEKYYLTGAQLPAYDLSPDRKLLIKPSFMQAKSVTNEKGIVEKGEKGKLLNFPVVYLFDRKGDFAKIFKTKDKADIVKWNPDGKVIALSEGAEQWKPNKIFFWYLQGNILNAGKAITIIEKFDQKTKAFTTDGINIKEISAHNGVITELCWSPDGQLLASASGDKTIKLWNRNGELVKTINVPSKTPKKDYSISAIAFSPDGKMIVSGTNYEKDDILLWDINGKQIKSIPGNGIGVAEIMFTADGQYVISSVDDFLKITNIKTGHSINMTISDKDWIVYTDDGYFDASRVGGKLVAMVKGNTAYEIDQFAIKNNRPDIILERMGLGSPEIIEHFKNKYLRRLKKSGIAEAQLSGEMQVPQTEIVKAEQDGKFMNIGFRFKDERYKAKSCNIFMNDVPVLGQEGKPVSGKDSTITERVELAQGTNKIEVSCINEAGVESFRSVRYADYTGKVKPSLYYIGFGVSSYRDSSLNLKYADKDAKDLGTLFSKMKGDYYQDVIVKTYLNEEVTKKNIINAKKQLSKAKVDDTLVVFIAGHGVHDTDKNATYYYLTHDTDLLNLSKNAADFELIENILQDVPPRNKIFLMDTCESGETEEEQETEYFAMAGSRGLKARTTRGIKLAVKKESKTSQKPRGYLLQQDRFIYNDLVRRSGAIVFSSSKGGEFSYEKDDYQNGLFTEEIINSLTGEKADTNKDKLLASDELREFVMTAVPSKTENM